MTGLRLVGMVGCNSLLFSLMMFVNSSASDLFRHVTLMPFLLIDLTLMIPMFLLVMLIVDLSSCLVASEDLQPSPLG